MKKNKITFAAMCLYSWNNIGK